MSKKIDPDRSASEVAEVPGDAAQVPEVVWDDSRMQTVFANVVNGSSTREEVSLFFGLNETWNLSEAKSLKVQLSNRVVLTPFAAKRLWALLGNILQSYEKRYGTLDITTTQSSQPS